MKRRNRPGIFLSSVLVVLLNSGVQGQLDEPSDVEKPVTKDDFDTMLKRIQELETRLDEQEAAEVDLSEEETRLEDSSSHVLSRPWFQNLTLSGYGAFDYLATGSEGLKDEGGFAVREAAFFIEADVWENISAFFEIRTDYKAATWHSSLRSAEIYVHFRNVLHFWDDDLLGIKVGRFDVPFSEEYLRERPTDNPLITNSAHWLYGFDEGILFHGLIDQVGWLVAVTDGHSTRNFDDDSDKAVNVKVWGNPLDPLYLSASFMRNGRTSRSAFRFSGSEFRPVGASDPSTLGTSPSAKIDAMLYGLDARWTFQDKGYIGLSFGQAFVDDKDPSFNRDFLWWSVEGLYNIRPDFYAVCRWSEIGTYQSNEGYHFEGTFTAGGNSAFGYDTRRFRRLAVGLGWKPTPNVTVKLEGGGDRFEMIDGSAFRSDASKRWFVGSEIVVAF